MKKITLFLLFTIAQLGFSQPILTDTNFVTGFSVVGFSANTTGFSNGASGENVVWDYSTINLTNNTFTYSIVPASEAYFFSSVPNANFCEKIESNGYIQYSLYILTNQTLELVGISNSNFISNYSNNTGIVFQFPYTYSNIIQDTQWATGSPTPPEPITRTYDAYGTLITPYATYNDVIRQKMVNGFGQVSYRWIATNPYRIILSGNFEDSSSVSFYADPTLITSQQTLANKFHLYPNPTTELFSITTPENQAFTVKVYDILGKQILENANYISNTAINLKEYSSGIYIIKITDDNEKVVFTGKIVKE